MGERRSLIEGVKSQPSIDPQLEKSFVYGAKPRGGDDTPIAAPVPVSPPATPVLGRSPISTRIRADYAAALKRASLERQLNGTEPHTLQDILEQAIEPWLKTNGYL